MTEPSSPTGYTYPTEGTPPSHPPYPDTPYAPSGRSTAGVVVAVVGGVVVAGVVLSALALFFFGFGTHVGSVTSTSTFVAGAPDGVTVEPLQDPDPGPADMTVVEPLQSAAEAEAAYLAENGSYTGAISDLRAFEYVPARGVRVEALTASPDRYCLRATNGKATWYATSDDPMRFSTLPCV